MKLIIDIPEDVYNVLVRDVRWANEIEKIIINGTPFDSVIKDIKAEISSYIDKEKLAFGGNFDRGLNMALKIIDKHCPKDKDISIDKNGNVWVKHIAESEEV